MTGFTFALFYIVVGLPIARWADRGVRRNIMALALGVWSLMTALSGLAQNYVQLLLARIGVGVGEAGGSPPSYSMLSDIFPREQRATALGAYGMGLNFGILTGFLTGGWINQYFGWRAAFFVAGIPGVLLAVLVRTTLREPMRRYTDQEGEAQRSTPAVAEVLRALWTHRTFRHMVWGSSLLSFAAYGMFNWFPSFLVRIHGLTTGVAGTWLALILGIGGAVATFGTGYLSDRLGRRDKRWYAWVTVIAACIALPLMVATFLLEDSTLALICFIFPGSVAAVCVPPLMAVTHSLVENRMRALATAIVLFILNLLGLGLGPLAVGMVSDGFSATAGTNGLRYAMLLLLPAATLWGLAHFLFAARWIRRELG
jgi:MFS family permease